MSKIANPQVEFYESTFKSLIWDNALEAGLAYLFGAAPYLNWWPLKQIITGIARLSTNYLFDSIKLLIDVQAIAFVNAQSREAYDNAFVKLKLIANDVGENSEEFKKAKEDAKQALSKFMHYGAAV